MLRLLLIAVFASASAFAAPPQPPPFEEVARVLELRPEQVEPVRAIFERGRAERRELREASREQRRSRRQARDTELAAVLSPEQMQRLQTWRQYGARVRVRVPVRVRRVPRVHNAEPESIAMSGYRSILFACGFTALLPQAFAQTPSTPAFQRVPSAATTDAYASFEFAAAGVQGYECALDGGVFITCNSPHTLPAVALGNHRFEVRAFAQSGSRGAPATHVWSVASVFSGSNADLIPTAQLPAAAAPNSWRGILRINCDFAHGAYDDPIVFPGQAFAAHQHSFYGFLGADYGTTIESLYASEAVFGNRVSSCQGDRLNRSAYWVPTLLAPLYASNGARAIDSRGEPAWQAVPAVVGNDDEAHEVFYYSAGIDDVNAIRTIPTGLRMIAGNMSVVPGSTPQSSSVVRWHCQSWNSSDADNPRWSATIPQCVAPDRLRFDIFFPSCWNGRDLDSADHKSHLAYPVTTGQNTVCPSSHPVPILRVSYHYAFGVRPENADPFTRSSRGWRLSSDMYAVTATQGGGLSLHGDWMNGWHAEVLQTLLTTCIKGRLDCHDGNLANGYRLSGTAAGTQINPEAIVEGMGPKHQSTATPRRGLWWDRSRSGHGLDLQLVSGQYTVAFYTYAADGTPVWYVGTAPMLGQMHAPEVHRYDYAGSRSPAQRAIVSSAALISLRFDQAALHSACRDGVDRGGALALAVFEFDIDGRRGSWCVEPYQFADSAAQPDFSGLWYSPADAGWGLTLTTRASGSLTVAAAVLYAYDGNGQGRWALGTVQGADVRQLPPIALSRFSGACAGCASGPVTVNPAGSLQLRLSEALTGSQLDVDAQLSSTGSERWKRVAAPISQISDQVD